MAPDHDYVVFDLGAPPPGVPRTEVPGIDPRRVRLGKPG